MTYIADKTRRQIVRQTMQAEIFQEAFEHALDTGEYVRVELPGVNFDSREAGLTKDRYGEPSSVLPGKSRQPEHRPDPLPAQGPNCSCSSKADSGVQCSLVKPVVPAGSGQYCRVCGTTFESQTSNQQQLWLRCEETDCDHWVEVQCIFGPSGRFTPAFVKDMPYTCPIHR